MDDFVTRDEMSKYGTEVGNSTQKQVESGVRDHKHGRRRRYLQDVKNTKVDLNQNILIIQ